MPAILLLAAVYVAGAKIGFLVAPAHHVVSSAWPPAGIALAALVLLGVRLWPGVLIGALLANFTSGIAFGPAIAIAAGNTLEALAGVWLLARLDFRPSMERLRDVLVLAATALTVTAISASVGVAALELAGAAAPEALGTLWLAWFTGDAIGILAVAPLPLTWSGFTRTTRWSAAIEPALLVLVIAALTALVVAPPFPFVYPVFPIAVLAAYRLGPRGAAVANVTVAGVAAYYTILGTGSFILARGSPTENLFLFQAFIALLAITTLSSAAVLAERQQAEAELRLSQAHLSEAQAVAQLGSWRWEPDTNRVTWSDEMYRIYGLDRRSFRATLEGFLERVHPEDRERVVSNVQQALAAGVGGTFQLDERIVRPNGEVRVLESRGKVVGGRGRGAMLIGICQDVTELRRAQRTLAESEAKFATMFQASPVAICVIGMEEVAVVDANARFLEMLGSPSRESVLGVSPRELGMWAEPGELRDLLARLRKQGSVRETPVKYLTREGQERRAVAALEVVEINGVPSAVALFWRP